MTEFFGFVDSGASTSLCNGNENFLNYRSSNKTIGSAVNSVSLDAVGEGTLSLPVQATDGSTVYIEVEALHCSTARYNLVSVSSLLASGMNVIFGQDNSGVVECKDGRRIKLTYEGRKRLWRMNFKRVEDGLA